MQCFCFLNRGGAGPQRGRGGALTERSKSTHGVHRHRDPPRSVTMNHVRGARASSASGQRKPQQANARL